MAKGSKRSSLASFNYHFFRVAVTSRLCKIKLLWSMMPRWKEIVYLKEYLIFVKMRSMKELLHFKYVLVFTKLPRLLLVRKSMKLRLLVFK